MEQIERLISIVLDRNWLDIGALIIIGVFFLIGLSSGLVFSAFRLISMFISLFMSLIFYNRLAALVYGTYAETVVNAFIYDGFLSNPRVSAAQNEANVDNALKGIVDMLALPRGFAEIVFKKPASVGEIRRTNIINDIVVVGDFSAQCTRAVIAIFCVIAVYVMIRLVISIAKIFLDEVAALKIFRLFNYIGGPVFGLVEGIATVYIALALLTIVNIIVQSDQIYKIIGEARFSRGFYEKNLFLDFALKRIKF